MQIKWHTDDKNIRYKWKLYASDKNTRCKYNDTLMTRIFATNENYMLQRRIHDANTMTHWWQEHSLQMKTICFREEYTMQIQWHTDDKNIRYKWRLHDCGWNTRCKYNEILMRTNIRYKWKLYASGKNTRCKYNDTLSSKEQEHHMCYTWRSLAGKFWLHMATVM